MECDICRRPHNSQKLPFLCAVDARNQLYEPRFASALALMESAELEEKVNEALSGPARLENLKSEQQTALDRTSRIIAQADRLRADLDAARKEIASKKEALARRKSDLASASTDIDVRRQKQLDITERAANLMGHKWNRSADIMAATRAFLCMEAARLYGLRRIKKSNSPKYEIGGVEIVELLGMNSKPSLSYPLSCLPELTKVVDFSPEAISTSLAHVAHILVLASHYLAIRLPAEITLPHRDYPRPTIFTLASSYQHPDIPFPGTGNLQSQIPSTSKDRSPQHLPRPRPLFIDKPLPALAKEDPPAYSLFVEGVTLLAYDVAWACCSQGITFSEKTLYEDACNMGQNLYKLLIGNQLLSNPAAQIFAPAASGPNNAANGDELADTGKTKNMMGRFSHGTAHTFLGGAAGGDFVRSFRLPNPVKLADRLRKKLISEAPMLEWEKIESEDVMAADDDGDDGIVVKGHKRRDSSRKLFGVESIATVATSAAPDRPSVSNGRLSNSPDLGGERIKLGANGWTKLKPR